MRRAADGLTIVLGILLALTADSALSNRGDRAEEARILDAALLDLRFDTAAHSVLDDAISSGRLDLIGSAEVRRALMAPAR